VARSAEMFLRSVLAVDFRRSAAALEIPEPGTLAVFAHNETCQVYVGDVAIGFPPIASKRIASGTHAVSLKCAGAPDVRQSAVVAPGQTKRVEFRD
jgi:hypothetical protein